MPLVTVDLPEQAHKRLIAITEYYNRMWASIPSQTTIEAVAGEYLTRQINSSWGVYVLPVWLVDEGEALIRGESPDEDDVTDVTAESRSSRHMRRGVTGVTKPCACGCGVQVTGRLYFNNACKQRAYNTRKKAASIGAGEVG